MLRSEKAPRNGILKSWESPLLRFGNFIYRTSTKVWSLKIKEKKLGRQLDRCDWNAKIPWLKVGIWESESINGILGALMPKCLGSESR